MTVYSFIFIWSSVVNNGTRNFDSLYVEEPIADKIG